MVALHPGSRWQRLLMMWLFLQKWSSWGLRVSATRPCEGNKLSVRAPARRQLTGALSVLEFTPPPFISGSVRQRCSLCHSVRCRRRCFCYFCLSFLSSLIIRHFTETPQNDFFFFLEWKSVHFLSAELSWSLYENRLNIIFCGDGALRY